MKKLITIVLLSILSISVSAQEMGKIEFISHTAIVNEEEFRVSVGVFIDEIEGKTYIAEQLIVNGEVMETYLLLSSEVKEEYIKFTAIDSQGFYWEIIISEEIIIFADMRGNKIYYFGSIKLGK